MDITLGMQVEFFIWSMIAGLFSGLLYDVFRALRKMTNPKSVTVLMQDILFIVLIAITVFIVSFTVGRGYIRWFEMFGVLCGFILYRLAFRDAVVKILIKLAEFLIKAAIIAVKILLFPFKIIYVTLIKPIKFIFWYVRRRAQKSGSALKIRKERASRGLKNFMHASRKK